MKVCSVVECSNKVYGHGFCLKHYYRMKRHGHVNVTRRAKGEGGLQRGYMIFRELGVRKRFHVTLAEKALGKPLPKGAVVHHVDQNPSNNEPTNLVVCPDRAYHQLIHQRMRAYECVGNSNYLKCKYCKQYDDPGNLKCPRPSLGWHDKCERAARKSRYWREKELKNALSVQT